MAGHGRIGHAVLAPGRGHRRVGHQLRTWSRDCTYSRSTARDTCAGGGPRRQQRQVELQQRGIAAAHVQIGDCPAVHRRQGAVHVRIGDQSRLRRPRRRRCSHSRPAIHPTTQPHRSTALAAASANPVASPDCPGILLPWPQFEGGRTAPADANSSRSHPHPVNDPCSTMHAATGTVRSPRRPEREADLEALPFQASQRGKASPNAATALAAAFRCMVCNALISRCKSRHPIHCISNQLSEVPHHDPSRQPQPPTSPAPFPPLTPWSMSRG